MDAHKELDKNLKDYLEENFQSFTHTQKRVAHYLLSNTDEASFLTADEMAAKIHTTSSTVVRFARELGYSGYPDLQKDLRTLVLAKIKSIGQLEKAREFKIPHEGLSVIDLSLQKDAANLNELIQMKQEDALRQFVDVILASRKKCVVANRSAFSLGHFLFYKMRKILPDVLFLNNLDGGMFDILRELSSDDVVIAISFPRYTKLTIDFARYAAKKNVNVLSISDSRMSPLFGLSQVCLFSPYEGTTFLTSNVAAMALINAIISEIFGRDQNLAVQQLEEEETILIDLDTFESQGKGFPPAWRSISI